MKKAALLLAVLYVLLYVAPLGLRPLILPDETRYGAIPSEMLTSGDWTVPRLCGLRYFEKPVLGYWLTALSMSLFGDTAFAVRLPSALAAGGTALVLAWLVGRAGGTARMALLVAALQLSFVEAFGVGVFNVLDSVVTLFLTAALAAWFVALEDDRSRHRRVASLLAGAACGGAFLTKGFLAFAVPAVVLVPGALWIGRARRLPRVLGLSAAGVLIVSLPWAIAVHVREPTYWHYFFWVEHVERFLGGGEGQHPEPFWFLAPFLVGGALPGILLAPWAVRGLRERGFRSPLLRCSICWLLFPFLFFSASSGKLGTYVLPCFPGLALLLGAGVERALETRPPGRGLSRLTLAVAGVAFAAAAGLVVLQVTGIPGFEYHHSPHVWGVGESGKWLVILAGLLWCGVAMVLVARISAPWRRVGILLGAPCLLLFTFHTSLPDSTAREKTPVEVIRAHRELLGGARTVVSTVYVGPAITWVTGRRDVLIAGDPGELETGLSYEDAAHRVVDSRGLFALADAATRDARVVIVMRARRWSDEFSTVAPEPTWVESRQGFAVVVYSGERACPEEPMR